MCIIYIIYIYISIYLYIMYIPHISSWTPWPWALRHCVGRSTSQGVVHRWPRSWTGFSLCTDEKTTSEDSWRPVYGCLWGIHGNSNISNLILWWYLWSIHSHHSHTMLRDVHDIHVFYVFCVYVYQDLAGIAAFRSATICRLWHVTVRMSYLWHVTSHGSWCDIPWLIMAPGMVLRDRCPSATRHSSDTFRETFRETLDIRSRRNSDDSGRYQMSCI